MAKPEPIPVPAVCKCCGIDCTYHLPGAAPEQFRVILSGPWSADSPYSDQPCANCDLLEDVEIILDRCPPEAASATTCYWIAYIPACIEENSAVIPDTIGIGIVLSCRGGHSGHSSDFYAGLDIFDFAYTPTPEDHCSINVTSWHPGGYAATWEMYPTRLLSGLPDNGFNSTDIRGKSYLDFLDYPPDPEPKWYNTSYSYQCNPRSPIYPYDFMVTVEVEAV